MLKLNEEKKDSKYKDIYDLVVPKTHLLRKIKENVDFSFANKIMEECYCKNFGRPAYEPEQMLKMMFLKILYDLSDREVTSRSQTDMAFKFFLNLNPEDEVPDHSLLAKFRTLRMTEEKLKEFLDETVRQALKKKL